MKNPESFNRDQSNRDAPRILSALEKQTKGTHINPASPEHKRLADLAVTVDFKQACARYFTDNVAMAKKVAAAEPSVPEKTAKMIEILEQLRDDYAEVARLTQELNHLFGYLWNAQGQDAMIGHYDQIINLEKRISQSEYVLMSEHPQAFEDFEMFMESDAVKNTTN